MAEAIHCPSCTTRYRLRTERLKPVIRRAKCCSCGGEFPIGDIVQRLLAPPAQDPTAAIVPVAVAAVPHEDFSSAELTSSLTPGDLDGSEMEILDKTLVAAPAALPEAKAETPAPSYPPEITETTLSGYTSARDAIEKLFGSATAAATGPRKSRNSGSMDMEATLSALDTTLGAAPATPVPAHPGGLSDSPTAAGLTEDDLEEPSRSTLRLSQAEMLAAIAAAPAPKPLPPEPTVALRASDLVSARETRSAPPGATAPIPRSFTPLQEVPDPGAELLRLKIGEEIYGGLTMPQLIDWVEEGRILENHLVARQHSENWLEAHKVPGLRPIFERLRRERTGGAPSLDSGAAELAPKKGLFGGLFGKN